MGWLPLTFGIIGSAYCHDTRCVSSWYRYTVHIMMIIDVYCILNLIHVHATVPRYIDTLTCPYQKIP